MPEFPFMTVPEAAKFLHMSEEYIRRLLRDGKFTGRRVGKSWLLDEKEVKRYAAVSKAYHKNSWLRKTVRQ